MRNDKVWKYQVLRSYDVNYIQKDDDEDWDTEEKALEKAREVLIEDDLRAVYVAKVLHRLSPEKKDVVINVQEIK